MPELRQFNLQFAFRTARAAGKNIQDQAGTIQHAAFDRFFQVSFRDGLRATPNKTSSAPVALTALRISSTFPEPSR